VALYWKNPDPRHYVNVVPTSAITGMISHQVACTHAALWFYTELLPCMRPVEGFANGVRGLRPNNRPTISNCS